MRKKLLEKKNGLARKVMGIALAVAMVGSGMALLPANSSTANVYAATNNAPQIEEVDYEKGGIVDVDFYGRVKYKNAKVSVKKLSTGKVYKAEIIGKDSDDLTFISPSYKAGEKYKFTISGIKKASAAKYTSVSGYFTVPKKATIKVEDIEYDRSDNELSFEFGTRVRWKNPTVKIMTASGSTICRGEIIERSSDELEVYLPKKLSYGTKYKYKITGIKARSASEYRTLSGSFVARD